MRTFLNILFSVMTCTFVLSGGIAAQTTSFTYQGNLNLSGTPANGNYDLTIVLFDAASGGSQIGIQELSNVPVTNGVFSVTLSFAAGFPGANRFIEIRVRPAGGGAYTTLSPRQSVSSVPYAIKSITAENANNLAGIPAATYVLSGSTTINAGTQFNISGQRILSSSGVRNVFVGSGAGTTNPNVLATDNTFVGYNTGAVNTTGAANSFFGSSAGQSNTDGGENSFFGTEAGSMNLGGDGNSFFGRSAGKLNTTGNNNSFFGATAGDANVSGSDNSFFGRAAGGSNTTGARNSYFGRLAGQLNIGGFDNAAFGYQAGQKSNENNNSFFGSQAGRETTSGGNNSFFGMQSGLLNSTGSGNSIFGVAAGSENTIGADNSFFGVNSGRGNTTGNRNTFVGRISGRFNTTGNENTFIGYNTASSSITGNNNTAIGASANVADGLSFATVIGSGASVSTNNTVVIGRSTDRVLVRGEMFIEFLGSLRFNTVNFGGDAHICHTNFTSDSYLGGCSSSIAHKSNVVSTHNGYDIIKRLRPVTFNWIRSGKASIGLIAEEVNAIDPLLSTYDKDGALIGVQWNGITVSLVNAAKEQQAQIDKLQETVRDQNVKIDQLQQMICELKPEARACRKE